MRLKAFIGSSSAILQPIDLSIGYVVYLNITYLEKKDSWQDFHICGFQSHITAKFKRCEGLRLRRLHSYSTSAASTITIVLDPCLDIWG